MLEDLKSYGASEVGRRHGINESKVRKIRNNAYKL